MEKIGVGIVTYNRGQLFQKSIQSLPPADEVIVVNDGNPYPDSFYPSLITSVIQHDRNRGVGRSKNDALEYLLGQGCVHIFLLEDDIKIINPDIFRIYIHASELSGIKHFNFAYHGSENKNNDGSCTKPRKIVSYKEGITISFHRHLLAAMQYFHRDVLEQCGLMDPFFHNMLEHIDHTYRIIKHGFHPPFWWFADIEGSQNSIEDLDPFHLNSTIRNNSFVFGVKERISHRYFWLKHGQRIPNIPDVSENEVEKQLERIRLNYSTISLK